MAHSNPTPATARRPRRQRRLRQTTPRSALPTRQHVRAQTPQPADSATGLPPGVRIDPGSGLISGTIASNASVTTPYNVTVTATDGTDPASATFAWNISNFTLDNPGDQTNAEGDAVALQSTVQTNGNPTLTFSASGLPNGLSINPSTGLIAGTVANFDANSSPYNVTVSASDGVSTSSQTFTWTITHVLLIDPADQINAPDDRMSLQVQASDPDGDTLTYGIAGLPPGLSINSATGLISGLIASTAGSDTPYNVTVTASDGAHTATGTFNWTVANEAVTVSNPGTQTNAEGDNVGLQIHATDSAGNPLSYTATGLPAGLQIDNASGLISGTVDSTAAESNGGVYQVTVLADDGQGNNGSATFTWNVTHTNQAPTLDNPGDQLDQAGDVVALPLTGYDGDGDTLTYSAAGLPSGLSVDPSSGLISGTLPASAASATSYIVTVNVSDGTLSASQTFNWFVTTNQVTLANPGNQINTEGESVSLQLSATGDSALSYQAGGLPSGLSIDSGSGLISGTIAAGDAANGPYTVTVSATDALGYSSGQQFTWNVNAVNLTPVVGNPGPQINAQGDVLSLQIQATDPAGNGLTYSAAGLPPGLSINASSGLISGVLSNSSAAGSPYSVTVTAVDGSNSGSATFTWSVTNNQSVTVTNPGTQNSVGGSTVSLQINATDSANLALTYAATGLPPGAAINASTGLISGTLDVSDGGSYQATVMASDSAGNSGSAAFAWNVRYVNQAPSLDNPGDQRNKAGDAVSLQLSGSDVDGDTLTYSATGLPSGLRVDAATGLIAGTLASSGSTTPYPVTVTASDGLLTARQSFEWFVTADVVTLANPGDQTNTEGDSVSLQLAASDANHSALSYTAGGLPVGLGINASTGLISGTLASGDAANGPYTVTVMATDAQGDSNAQQFTWNVNPPASTLTLANPGNQSNAEGDVVTLQVQASDADGDTLSYTASGLPVGLSIDVQTGLISGTVDYSAAEVSRGQYNVTVTVNDGNDQTASQSFGWSIRDTEQGPWLAYPGLQVNTEEDKVSLQLDAGSPDGKALLYSASGLPSGLTVDPNTGKIGGTIAKGAAKDYTATVTDGVKSATQTFAWQVTSTPAPRVILAINGTVDHSDDVGIVNPTVRIPLTITLQNADPNETHLVQVNISANRSELDDTVFQMANGASVTTWITPLQASQVSDDVELDATVDNTLAAKAKMTNEQITIQSGGAVNHILNKDTPTGMADRIPPSTNGVTTPVTITFSVDLGPGEVLYASIAGQSADNGAVLFADGGTRYNAVSFTGGTATGAKGAHMENLGGTSQTKPGHAGKLSLSVGYGPKPSKDDRNSAGFSVDAIPISVTETAATPKAYLEGQYVGMRLRATFHSDSLDDKDLVDHILVLEKVKVEKQTGSWEKLPPFIKAQKDYGLLNSDAQRGDTLSASVIALAVALELNKSGSVEIYQAHLFSDLITKQSGFPIKESGFLRIYSMTKPEKGDTWKYTVLNKPSATEGTKLGIKVSPGKGAEERQSFAVKSEGEDSVDIKPEN